MSGTPSYVKQKYSSYTGRQNNKLPTISLFYLFCREDISKQTFLAQCSKEGMRQTPRLHCPVFFVARNNTVPLNIECNTIPTGTLWWPIYGVSTTAGPGPYTWKVFQRQPRQPRFFCIFVVFCRTKVTWQRIEWMLLVYTCYNNRYSTSIFTLHWTLWMREN